ncbi:MAG: hypothetical protein IJ795_08645 [Bacteroidales bacterium]|nr:hypothetical protein [Bacteroidales bacterium]
MKRIILVICAALAAFTMNAQKFSLPGWGSDGIRVLLIGNSFTFYHDCDSMLVQIARSQGVRIYLGEYLKGGQTFGQHLNLPQTSEAIAGGRYDYAFIQDYSASAAWYARDKANYIAENTILLKRRILQASPSCKIILERTWTFDGNNAEGFSDADTLEHYLAKGSKKLSRKCGLPLSPIGDAFNIAAAERPDIDLLGPDRKHQSAAGSYLKCCINWLIISGKPFAGKVAECGLDPAAAEYLRGLAERMVLSR